MNMCMYVYAFTVNMINLFFIYYLLIQLISFSAGFFGSSDSSVFLTNSHGDQLPQTSVSGLFPT